MPPTAAARATSASVAAVASTPASVAAVANTPASVARNASASTSPGRRLELFESTRRRRKISRLQKQSQKQSGAPSPVPSVRRFDAGACSFDRRQATNLNRLLTLDGEQQRCSVRHLTLEQAGKACAARVECVGVVRDNGIRCADGVRQFELRGGFVMPQRGHVSWVCASRADSNNDGRVDAREFGQYSAFAGADTNGDGIISSAELAAYTEKVQEHAQQQHAQYAQQLELQQAEAEELRAQLKLAQQQGYEVQTPAPVNQVPAKSKSSFCVVQ